jgi:hypothetical protein
MSGLKLDSLMAKDEMDLELRFMSMRGRLPSETCMSLSHPHLSSTDHQTSQMFAVEQSASLEHVDDDGMKDTSLLDEFDSSANNIYCGSEGLEDLISHLKPTTVSISAEMSTAEMSSAVQSERQVLVSREGKRKQRVSQAASMIKHSVRRRKKSETQVKYLRELFDMLGGEWDGKCRKEAMEKTGLSRIQIYKWFFDMKLTMKPKEKRVAADVRVSYSPSIMQSFNVDDDDFDVIQPIFRVEKVVRT